jgi:hypothetical protein
MMTQEEIDAYIELQNKFQLECENISDELGRYKWSYGYLREFSLDGDNIYGEGDEYCARTGEREYYGELFPIELLKMTDEERRAYVDNLRKNK